MTTRTQALVPIIIAAVIVGVIGLMSIPEESKLESVEFPRGTIKVDEVTLEVQIADTEPRQVRGLMFQDQLPSDQGMIFVFDEPGLYSLWMLNMQFHLDMIWFDENGKVVHIEKDVPPCKTALEISAELRPELCRYRWHKQHHKRLDFDNNFNLIAKPYL